MVMDRSTKSGASTVTRLDDKIARFIFGRVQFLRFTLELVEIAVFLILAYALTLLAPVMF
jgi:hypothetical protein